jgi:hypothetical protein
VTFINEPLLERGVNWLVVGCIASIWLLAFHVGVGAFQKIGGNS